MLSSYFLKGLIIGFMVAVPVGPINVLCVRRTLVHGRLVGLISGLGAAAADTLFGSIAAFGLIFVAGVMMEERIWLSFVGGGLLVVIGLRTLLTSSATEPSRAPDPTSLAGDFTSTFFLTLTNPITILSFLAIFAAFGIQADEAVDASDWLLLLGVFLGSTGWWVLLTGLVGLTRERFTQAGFRWLNRIAGAVILGFAVVLLWEAARLAA